VFLVAPDDEVLAVDNVDPCSGAAVLSRGIVGSAGDVLTVASPIYKQRFDLRTGLCLDDPHTAVATFLARVVDGTVQVNV
jgi:nitrite reductase (NADH) small subunit